MEHDWSAAVNNLSAEVSALRDFPADFTCRLSDVTMSDPEFHLETYDCFPRLENAIIRSSAADIYVRTQETASEVKRENLRNVDVRNHIIPIRLSYLL